MTHDIFNFSPIQYSEELKKNGFVLIIDGVSTIFLNYIKKAYNTEILERKFLEFARVEKKKQQILFEFSSKKMYSKIISTIAKLISVNSKNITISERHIKIYDANAEPRPDPHKDRFASQFAIAIPIFCTKTTKIILYPNHSRKVNPLNKSITWKDGIDSGRIPKKLLFNKSSVKIKMKPGDLFIFKGSSIYHERYNGASTIILYLKIQLFCY